MISDNTLHQLSESQKSIWYLEKAYPGLSLNIVAGTLRLKGEICYDAISKALNTFVKRHDSMRIRINEKDGVAYQYVTEHEEFKVDYLDFSARGGLKELFEWDEATTKTSFDIIENPLFYCACFKINDEESGLYMKMHHLISDAWTMGLATRQIIDLYSKIKRGQAVDESPAPSYIDHLARIAEYEESARFAKDKIYWNEKFETLPELTVLKPQAAVEPSIRAKRKTLITPVKFSNKLREFSKENGLSVFTLFMAALSIYINRVTDMSDIVLGTTILNRVNIKEKETAGMFVSVAAPVRVELDDSMDFKSFAKVMLKENTNVLKHQKYPYNYLLRDIKKRHKLSDKLFDIVLSYQNSKFNKNESEEEYVAKWIFTGCQIESLMISINDREDGGNLIIDYDFLTDVFSIKEIEFIHQHILSLLWHALDNPTRKISKLDMISEKEKHTLLHDFNDTAADFPRDKMIHQIFEEQVEKTPDNIALILNDEKMTYRELNEKSNRLARTLRAGGVGSDVIVGLILDKSFNMLVAMMSVSKAGGAFMPIDPDHPSDRKTYMLQNSSAKVLLTKKGFETTFDGTTIFVDDDAVYHSNTSNLELTNKSSDLVYIIYTSGSTGNPKGVMTEHRNVVGLFFNDHFGFDFSSCEVWSFFHAYCFDLALWEVYGALLRGGAVVLIVPEVARDMKLFLECLKKNKVTVLTQTPQAFYRLIDMEMKSENKELSLRHVCLGGEALKPAMLKPMKEKYAEIAFNNLYGPTETTMYVTQKKLNDYKDFDSNLSNIGSANPLTKVFVLDRLGNLLPIGIPGELCISGNGVSRGYINNPQLTVEKFIENPIDKGDVLYKTGDLVRLMPKGEIIYLGRADNQVKIRGYRIELGEIENALLKHSDIDKVIVTVREISATKKLCVYYQAKKELGTKVLSDYLATYLPGYMIPSFYTKVDYFPLSKSGKINLTALPEPFEIIDRAEHVVPESLIEIELIKMWEEVLGIKNLGVLDNFFYIGGDSLNAVSVAVMISKQLEIDISPRELFRYPTIRDLGALITTLTKAGYSPISTVKAAEYYPVSSAQKRQYILNRIDGGTSYNVPGGLRIDGDIDAERLKQVIRKMIQRHESLRTSFEMTDGEPVQIVHDTVDFGVEYGVADEVDFDELMMTFVRPFDLGLAPLLRVKLVRFSSVKHLLMFDIHHIISDGASLKIFIREFAMLYNGRELPELQIQYKDYAAWHNALLKSDKIRGQETYWLDRFSGEIPVLNMPIDFTRPSFQSFDGERLSFTINEKLTKSIKELAGKTETTLFMLLLAAYKILLFRYTGQEDIIVGIPIEGRRHNDLRGLIGMFVNTLAIRSYPQGEKTFESFLDEIKDDLLNAYDNQEYPLESIITNANIKRDASRNPLFDTTFSLRNHSIQTIYTDDFTAELCENNSLTAKFDLMFEAVDRDETISVSIEYSTALFKEETINRLAGHFENILHEITDNPAKHLRDISMLSEAERYQLLVEFNDTEADFPRDKTIHQIFEEQVDRAPDNIALIFNDEKMTYRELNEKANRLARTLRTYGVGPDMIVGLIIDRSFDMIIAMLAVLKAGGAYMPIDIAYPLERQMYMLDNSGSILLLTKKTFNISYDGITVLLDDEAVYDVDLSNLSTISRPCDLAYIIYTSGSTGEPKGVMIEHRNVVGLFFNDRFEFDFQASDVWTLFHSYCFDFTVWEMYGALLRGGKLIIISTEIAQNQTMYLDLLKKERVTVLNQTPQSMYNLIELEGQSENKELYIRYVFLGGESLKPSLIKPLKYRYPKAEFINLYGPTESTIFFTFKKLSDTDNFETNLSNIGPVIATMKAYVLDKYLHLVPQGIPGELYACGNGISRGYINNAQLTTEKFIVCPFSQTEILYKTGDVVRMMSNGDMIYLGRTDNQVKIRGFRIELGEIENALLKHPAIHEAVMIVFETTNSSKKLCAYVKMKSELSEKELSFFLSEFLPNYMIPTLYVKVDAFPINQSGKIDKARLPQPYKTFSNNHSIRPRNETENMIERAWCQVLDISDIGIDDDFFHLGGDSLSAIKVVTKLKLDMNIVDFYTCPTIRLLANKLSANNKSSSLLINLSKSNNPDNKNVICFPYGGGSALSYKDISDSVKKKSANLNIYAVNLPGHDYGSHDTMKSIETVSEELANEISANISGDLVLYGHCAGSALLLLTVKRLEQVNAKIKSVFIGALLPPRLVKFSGWWNKAVSLYTAQGVKRYLSRAGIPQELLSDDDYLHFMRRVLRDDQVNRNRFFYLWETSKVSKLEFTLNFVVGDKDPATKHYSKRYRRWNKYFRDINLIILNDAEHFFINSHSDEVVDYLVGNEHR